MLDSPRMAETDPKTELVAPAPRALSREQEKRARDLAKVEEVENELFIESAKGMSDVLRFCQEWDPTDQAEQDQLYLRWQCDPEIGPERAKRLRNLVRAAWLGKKEAPVWLDIVRTIYVSGVKARATRDGGSATMNVQMVQMSAPMPAFPKKLIREEDK
jgi:hypothetical protein